MFAPSEFIKRWGNEPLLRFPAKSLESLSIAKEDQDFLMQAGLPQDAAPFLTFEAPEDGSIPSVAEQWGLPSEFQRYRTIGGDGSGNPIAVDVGQRGEIVCLNHEAQFARVFMNQSIRQLAASLLAYRKLIADTQAEFGPDAFLDGKTSPAARKELRRALTEIDPTATKPGCFWDGELQNLDANAA